MMQRMRENTKVILWVVVVAFLITIFAVWGLDLQSGSMGQKQNEAGRVNGVAVSMQTYQQIYSQLAGQFRTQGGGDLSSAQQEMVREQAWDNIVSNMITSEEIKKLGIGVTDEEILTYLRTSPPPEVQQYFRTEDGTFDFAAYQAALNNPEADWSAVEDLARQRIPVIKLNQYLTAQVHVSAAEVRRAFEEENVKLLAEYVAFPIDAEDIGDWAPSEADVQAHYTANADRYQEAEKATLEYVRIPLQPSSRDRSDLLYSAAQIRGDATGDFAAVARTYSEAPTAAVGGETGFIGHDQRDVAVMAAVAALKPGEVSQPIPTADGVYVVQLIASKKEKGETRYNLREIFMRLAPGSETNDSLSTLAQDIRERAAGNGDLAAAAKASALATTTTEPFMRGIVPGIGFVPSVTRFAFDAAKGAVSGILSDDRNIYVCKLVDRTAARPLPIADVAESIRSELIRTRKLDMALRKAEGFRKSAAIPDAPFAKAAAQYGYKVMKTDSFTVATSPPEGMGPNSPFARAALSVEAGTVTGAVESGNSVYVIRVAARTEPPTSVLQARGPALLEEIRQRKIQDYVMYWYTALKDKSKIEDFRDAS